MSQELNDDNRQGGAEVFDLEEDARKPRESEPLYASFTEGGPDDQAIDPKGYQRKVSLSAICTQEDIARAVRLSGGATGPVRLVRVIGQLSGLTPPVELPARKAGDLPRITFGLTGRIEATNLLSGEVLQASTLYLPEGFQELLTGELQEELDRTDGQSVVEIAMDFFAIPASNPRGYSWRAQSLMPPRRNDPLARLRARGLLVSTAGTRRITHTGEGSGATPAK